MHHQNHCLKIQAVSPKDAPLSLLLEADPSGEKVKAYLRTSTCYLATLDETPIGVFVLQQENETTTELLNIAIAPSHQKQGWGTILLKEVIKTAKANGARKLKLGTGTFGYQLAYYQKAGFRVVEVEKDYFLNHYPEPIYEQGIQHCDRLILGLVL